MSAHNLHNPFVQIAGFRSLMIGFSGFLLTTYLAFKTGTHFNGMLNIDFARDADYWFFAVENLSNWSLTAILMLLCGIVLSKSKVRMIDVFGTTLLSRLPLAIVPVMRLIPAFQSFAFQSWQMYFATGLYFISVVMATILLYNAFKVSCNLKNERLIISFFICMILSEIGSKIIITLIT